MNQQADSVTAKQCSRCKSLKRLEDFAWYNKAAGRRQPYCRGCYKAIKAERQANGKARAERLRYSQRNKDLTLQRIYGISLEEYNSLFGKQGGLCAICGRPEAKIDSRYGTRACLAVDHDHATGKVRGLLCGACNQGVGAFRDDPDLLRRAIAYLSTHRA